ncbi:MAG: hypothetical protein JNM79_01860 [Burkholderiales bacterium]|nr:hypothetical protein [Burkholderiales bacterium]
MHPTRFLTLVAAALLAQPGLAQTSYAPYGNGPVVLVQPGTPAAPYGYTTPSWGGTGVLPYAQGSGVVVTPGGAVPYGRYNREAARDAFRINNAVGGARAANDAANATHQPLRPLNPMPGELR